MNITSPITTAPRPISAQPHPGSPLLLDWSEVVPGDVTLTVLLVTVVLAGAVSVLVSVTVSVLAGSVSVFVSVLVAIPPPVPVSVVVVCAITVSAGPRAAINEASATPAASPAVSLEMSAAVRDLTC
jgi:hypothetical protein